MSFVFDIFNYTSKNKQNECSDVIKIKRRRFLANCCGIVGYLGYENTNEVLLHGINAMKSRGYDSCGICTLDNGKLLVTKCCSVGTPADSYNILKKKVLATHSPSRVGIGHTRWATVGKPSDKNSHPHVDLARNLALVHNGTISNIEEVYTEHYKEMIKQKIKECSAEEEKTRKRELENGVSEDEYCSEEEEESKFKLPDSDTEALAIFVGLEYEKVGDLYIAFKNTIKKLKGTWALCMMSTSYPNSLFVAAHEAPLLFARSKKGIYVGSEPTVFMKYARDCIALNDGDVFELSLDNVETYYREAKLLKLEHEVIEDTHEPYANWYMKEISEQMYLGRIIISMLNVGLGEGIDWSDAKGDLKELAELKEKYKGHDSLSVLGGDPYKENMLLSRLDLAALGFRFSNLTPEVDRKLRSTRRLLFVACGSSHHAASYVAKILQKLNFFEMVEVDDASDLTLYRYYDEGNTVVHISNSGETLDCILASNYIKKINRHTLNVSLINTLHSSLERASDSTIHLRIGREKSVPSTKAVTAQIVTLLMFGLYIVQNANGGSPASAETPKEDDKTEYSMSLDGEYINSLSDTPTEDPALLEAFQEGKYVEHYGSCANYSISSLCRSLSMFPSAVTHMLKANPRYDQIAHKLVSEKVVYILGRGCGHIAALEASLKMKEVAYIQTEGVLSGAMKHGYYAMIIEKERTPTISIITSEDKEMTLSATMQLKARGSYIIAFTDMAEEVDFADIVVHLPNIGALTPALALIPFQIITSKIALLAGRNPDIPRGLAKTVTTL
ncbi:glucosamine--fructose-6-phosphate aminotransferase [Theileria orientalis strain Shintoku]|uniref:glutamine--fructose-6-phosphate transaminase (isomerizing) n=1 Tax=Theileria orientalis strain Shintoku TaxID=869250 RepID=J4D8C7_THEOR|nr:glucosamine--fructose-6-phosphate aminotransferase [Theileria orientalis strain Shintoku]PVC54887.1 glucosamine--fructose-6-phosphate aminotransferase [Theileria orientalis]BAM40710.1 glucosamine--fructose-6-phosphate aminotransferase [Theileria orientalis strain Shintoku]|eukprot:XP_009691011.1 glucosamine--fructose-6-phosphate aminotransferase [Theileria orientalis strain Shintoku]